MKITAHALAHSKGVPVLVTKGILALESQLIEALDKIAELESLISNRAAPDESTSIKDSHKHMFNAVCVDLGLINEALGLDPDDGGAAPILKAIKELMDRSNRGEKLAIAVMSDNGNMFVG